MPIPITSLYHYGNGRIALCADIVNEADRVCHAVHFLTGSPVAARPTPKAEENASKFSCNSLIENIFTTPAHILFQYHRWMDVSTSSENQAYLIGRDAIVISPPPLLSFSR